MNESLQYIGQGPYADCQIVAMCNALRWHGFPTTEHPSSEWEDLVDIGGARHGSVCRSNELAEHLGLNMKKVDVKRAKGRAPVMLDVWNPEIGTSLHVVLVVSWCDEYATVVNYRTETGPLVETLPLSNEDPPPRSERWTKLYLPRPGNVNRRAYLLMPTPALMREHLERL
jgi:hypothetical protein